VIKIFKIRKSDLYLCFDTKLTSRRPYDAVATEWSSCISVHKLENLETENGLPSSYIESVAECCVFFILTSEKILQSQESKYIYRTSSFGHPSTHRIILLFCRYNPHGVGSSAPRPTSQPGGPVTTVLLGLTL
jgi:hypothetical protein